jgi:hypothetical protein
MLFRRPKLIKWTLRKLDEIGMGTSPENGTVPCRPAFHLSMLAYRVWWSASFAEEFVDLLDLLRQSLGFAFGRLMYVFRRHSIPLIF